MIPILWTGSVATIPNPNEAELYPEARTPEELDQAISHAFSKITAKDAMGYFVSCGYGDFNLLRLANQSTQSPTSAAPIFLSAPFLSPPRKGGFQPPRHIKSTSPHPHNASNQSAGNC